MWQRFLVSIQWYRLRAFLWGRCFIRYPAKPGWKALVQEVASCGGLWKSPDGIIGAPLQWALLERRDGKLVAVEERCAWTGAQISGHTPHADGSGTPDLSNYGVRCARCGVRIHVLAAGMASVVDIPSCPPCRKAVRKAMHE